MKKKIDVARMSKGTSKTINKIFKILEKSSKNI